MARGPGVAAFLIGAELRVRGRLTLEEAARILANRMPGDWYRLSPSMQQRFLDRTRSRLRSYSRCAPIYEDREPNAEGDWELVWYWAGAEEPNLPFAELG